MFGHQDDQQQQQDINQIPQQSIDNAMGSVASAPVPALPPPIMPPLPTQTDDSWQHPGTPLESMPPPTVSPSAAAFPNSPILPAGSTMVAPADIPVEEDNINSGASDSNDLINIKQQALSQLSPLVGHLDQSPEEKFRTTMMMIQASDNQSMIKSAFEAAQTISDEKVRAQALLDVVNEINYFTQNQPNG